MAALSIKGATSILSALRDAGARPRSFCPPTLDPEPPRPCLALSAVAGRTPPPARRASGRGGLEHVVPDMRLRALRSRSRRATPFTIRPDGDEAETAEGIKHDDAERDDTDHNN